MEAKSMPGNNGDGRKKRRRQGAQAPEALQRPAPEARYREYGPPLVRKADGGFAADSTRELVKKWGVLLLLSPPRCPSYNGAIEAGIASMKARTDHHAARNGRPGGNSGDGYQWR